MPLRNIHFWEIFQLAPTDVWVVELDIIENVVYTKLLSEEPVASKAAEVDAR